MGDIITGVYYRLPDQVDKVGLLQIAEISFMIRGIGSHGELQSHYCLLEKQYFEAHTQSSRFLQCVDNNLLMQVVEEPVRRGVLLDISL